MVSLEFHDPSGAIEVKQPHAPRIATLDGKRIGFVSNEQWQAYRMLPRLKALLEADFPGIEVLPIDAFPQGTAWPTSCACPTCLVSRATSGAPRAS